MAAAMAVFGVPFEFIMFGAMLVGVALFHERGDNPRFWGTPVSGDEARQRTGADPFPQQFASPP